MLNEVFSLLLQKDPWRPQKPLASIKGCQKHTFPWQPRLSKVFPTHGFSHLHCTFTLQKSAFVGGQPQICALSGGSL